MKIGWRMALALLSVVLLAGCPHPLLTARPTGGDGFGAQAVAVPPLIGRVEGPARQTQSTLADIAVGATVSLIDTQTNNTIGSTVTDPNGNFQLAFSNTFRPAPGRIYYLEAFKGLAVGGQPNRAGADAARVRTLVEWQSIGGWQSITANSLNINTSTTALSVIASLRSATTPVNYAGLLNSLSGSTFTPGTSGVTSADFNRVLGLVNEALTVDTDPLYYVILDASSGAYLAQGRGGVSITSVNPIKAAFGTTVTISGTNLGSSPIVSFNGTPGAGTSVNGGQTVVTTSVPIGATSGPLTLQVGSLVFNVINFAVANWDGHNPFDSSNNLYIAGHADNSLYTMTPAGSLSLFVQNTLLNAPQGLTLDATGNVYVSCTGSNAIVEVTPQGAVSTYASGGALSTPVNVCLDASGRLFVANFGGGTSASVLMIPAGGGAPTVYGTGVSGAYGLAFAPDGSLWVTSGASSGGVYKIPAGGGGATQVTPVGFSYPESLCFDSLGNAYVNDNNGNRVAQITPSGDVTTFCSLPSVPRSIAMRTDGVLFVAMDQDYIEAFAANGGINGGVYSGVYSYGHLGHGVALDSARNLYVTSGSDWGKYTRSVYRSTYNASTGKYGFFTRWATGLPDPSSIAIDRSNNVYVGDWAEGIYRIDAGSTTPYKFAANLSSISGLACDSTGKLYAAAHNAGGIYRFNNGAVDKTYGFSASLWSIIHDPSGNFYVADINGGRVLKITPSWEETVLAKVGTPRGLAFGPDGNLYVSDTANGNIRSINPNTGAVSTFASAVGYNCSLAFDASGSLYVANQSNSRIDVYPPGGGAPSIYATGFPAAPIGMTFDPAGNLYVTCNQAIYRIPAGSSAPYTVSSSNVYSSQVYPNQANLYSLTYDSSTGKLYAGAWQNTTIYQVPSGGGSYVSIGNQGRFWHAFLTLGQDGNLYSTDSGYSDIARINLTTGTETVVGELPVQPNQIAIDPSDRYLYMTDGALGTVLRIDTASDSYHVMTDPRLSGLNGIAFNPVDGRLYFQPPYNQTQVFTDLASGTIASYGSGANPVDGIVFDPAGNLFGTTLDQAYSGSKGVLVTIPAGGGAGVPLSGCWFNAGYF